MIQIKARSTKNFVKIALNGSATVKNAEKIYDKINQSLQEDKNVELDIKDISETDLSFLQILGSLYKTLHERGKELLITDDALSTPVKEAIDRSGMFASRQSTIVPDKPSPFFEIINKTGG